MGVLTDDIFLDVENRGAPHRVPSVAIVGAGLVGTTTAYALLMSGTACEIVLIGRNRERLEGHVSDLRDAIPYSHPGRIVAGDYADCATANVIIVAVGVSQRRDANSRLDDLNRSGGMVMSVVSEIARQRPTGVLIVATNPVDVLTHAAWKWSGLPSGRVIGSGTSLDSSRLRRRFSERYGVAAEDVHAYVVGEHGDSQVALLSSGRIADTPLRAFSRQSFMSRDEPTPQEVAARARDGGRAILRAKGSTSFGIGAALTRITRAILCNELAVLPVCTLLPESMGLGHVSLSVPAIIGREGVHRIMRLQLSEEEALALQRSADIVKSQIESLNLPV
jgi:L-lactate dehydrogenase